MLHKVNNEIIVVYQAANAESGATINVDIYDETHTKDDAKSGNATEIGTTGRYYYAFTPDAAGTWIAQIQKSDGTGKVVKAFVVKAADEFGIKSVVDGIKTKTDNLPDSPAPANEYDTQLGTTERADKATVDAIKAKTDNLPASPAPAGEYDTQLGTGERAREASIDDIKGADWTSGDNLHDIRADITSILEDTDTMEADIRGADNDTLKTLSDQIDGIASPAMVG